MSKCAWDNERVCRDDACRVTCRYEEPKCTCGHERDDHNGPMGDCQARCLCEKCPDGTRNDCWCAGFKQAAEGISL